MSGAVDRLHEDLTALLPLVPPGVSRVLDVLRRRIEAANTVPPIDHIETRHLLPPYELSIAGCSNQPVNADQMLLIITTLCIRGFTNHSAKARTLWFARQVAHDIHCPYRIYRRFQSYQVIEYVLMRLDLPGIALPDCTAGAWWELVAPVQKGPH